MVNLRRAPALSLLGLLLAGACQDPPTTGTLTVNVTGLPTGGLASIRIVGPNQFFQMVRETQTLENLVPGDYVINRDTVIVAQTRYGVPVVNDTVTIVRGRGETLDATYGIASGSIALTISGLPAGIGAALVVRGPIGSSTQFSEGVSDSRTILGLRPGLYEIAADTTFAFTGDKFAALKRRDTVAVTASTTPVAKAVDYMIASGTLELTVSGLPSGYTGQPVRITGPSGYIVQTALSRTLRGLEAGTYSIAAENVTSTCPNMYMTSTTSQSVSVTVGQTASAVVSYSAQATSPDQLNLTINRVYLTQATQNAEGTVPMLTGKPALLRVFGVANQCNDAKPQVRVTLSTGTQVTINATEDSVRTAPNDAVLGSSWNYVIPADVMQTGLTVVAEIDPANTITETNNSDNRYPATGTFAPDIRTAPVVGLRFVPVTQSVNNLTGNVNTGNVDQFLEWPRKVHPVGQFDVDYHAPYTTSQPALTANGSSTWSAILNEIRALQTSEGSARYYYGVVRVSYNSGIAGIAYVPGKSGLGWDYLPSGSRIMAHELGHNYGRLHAPCGGPSGIDASYPSTGLYSGGRIGVTGWDPVEGLKAPDQHTDIMGYCNQQWISDYTYVAMLDVIVSRGPSLPSTGSNEGASLLIWGRIVNGEPVLEPAFEISARRSMPAPGPHRVVATDADGSELFAVSFSGDRIADIAEDVETFAFTVPVSALRGRTPASLKLTARGRTVTSTATGDVGSDPGATITRVNSRSARVRWDASRFPVVMVRDANGQVLSFARGGDVTIATAQSQLDLNFSNRVRSTRRLKDFK